jgi:hypothetical protein
MEEHFMVSDFMEYFAETYPNINSDIAKLASGALMDFGERRLAVWTSITSIAAGEWSRVCHLAGLCVDSGDSATF